MTKAISSVVSTALLLVIAVVAAVTFQGWFGTYITDLQTEVESGTPENFQIQKIVGSDLYVRNPHDKTISPSSLKVGGHDCIAKALKPGITRIPLDQCSGNITSGDLDIVMTTNSGVTAMRQHQEYEITRTNLLSACPENYTAVPGGFDADGDGGEESGFCIMTYEAKNDGGTAVSRPSGSPWTYITHNAAKNKCDALGKKYSLISNQQWIQVAKLATNNSQNWISGEVGNGSMYRGHTDDSPSNPLAASANPDNGYYNTGNSAPSEQRRTLHIEDRILGDDPTVKDDYNGTIWDFSGNIWDWTNDVINCSSGYPCAEMPKPTPGFTEFPDLTSPGTYLGTYEVIRPNSVWTSSKNIGTIFTDDDAALGYPDQQLHAFRRGGLWFDDNRAGVFTLNLARAPTFQGSTNGFRCVYEP